MKTLFNKIDQQILLNYPQIWATQLHKFCFAYTMMLGATLFVALIYPMSTANVPDVEAYFVFPLMLSGIAFLIWLYQASLFKVSTLFGEMSPVHSFRMQLAYLLIVSMLAFLPYSFVQVMNFRMSHLVTQKEFQEDIVYLNKYGYFNFDFKNYSRFNTYTTQTDTVAFHSLKTKAELEKHLQTVHKYGGKTTMTAQELYDAEQTDVEYIENRYKFFYNINLISQTKEGSFFFQKSDFYWLTAVCIFALTFLSFIILATSFKTFLLSVVTGIIGSMLMGLLTAFSGAGEIFVLLFWIIVAMLHFYAVAGGNTRFDLKSKEIALSLVMAFTPFVPLTFLGMIFKDSEAMNAENLEAFLKSIFVFSVILSWLLWQYIYLPTLKKIQAEPVRD